MVGVITLVSLFAGATHAQQPPAISFASIMDTYFDDSSGLIRFDRHVVAFPPDGPFVGEVAVLNAEGGIVARYPFFDSIQREGVFGIVRVQGPADVQLTEPGLYTIVYLVAGQPVTRMPVRLRKQESGDPFNPEATYTFDGYWRTMAYLAMRESREEKFPELHFWVGGMDLPEGKRTDMYYIELRKLDGEESSVIAHSKRQQGHIPAGHFERTKATLYHPHTERQSPNAEVFMLDDWLVDGQYEVLITRQSDGEKIRSFDFDVEEGKIKPLPQTALDFEPRIDLVLPRVQRRNLSTFVMEEVIWIRDERRENRQPSAASNPNPGPNSER